MTVMRKVLALSVLLLAVAAPQAAAKISGDKMKLRPRAGA
jgi:hypothetical protein